MKKKEKIKIESKNGKENEIIFLYRQQTHTHCQ